MTLIPQRRRIDLPDHVRWIITDRSGQLVVYLASNVPPDSPLEQVYVRQAVRAWQRRQTRPPAIVPIAVAGGWFAQHLLRREVAAGAVAVAAAGGVAFGAMTLTDPAPHHRPPAAEAPHTPWVPHRPGARPPAAGPSKPARPPMPHQPVASPQVPQSSPGLSGDLALVPITARTVRQLPGTVRRPQLPTTVRPLPPVAVPPVASPPQRCRLVRVDVGRLVRVCL